MHIVITGASSGIGAALAREYAATGASLTLVARRRDLLDAIASEFPGRVHVIARDLSNPEDCTDWLAEAERVNGPIDVFVNNAGIQQIGPMEQIDPAFATRTLHLNLIVPLRLTAAVLPTMLARGAGTIVDVASVAALAPTPGMVHYNASKAGLAAASESLRGELRGTGVHVVTVYPGVIPDTHMGASGLAKFEGQRAVTSVPQGNSPELARRVRRAVERKKARVIYPASMTLARWFPASTRWFLDRFTPSIRATGAPAHLTPAAS